MAKETKTVSEFLKEIAGKPNKKGKVVPNRFNKKTFSKLMKVMANDPDFTTEVVDVKNGEANANTIMVSKKFREWCQKLVEKFGVDKKDSEIILSKDFQFGNMDGLYEFFATALYEYISAGNYFEFIPKSDFKGKVYIKDIPETTVVRDAKKPQTGEYIGTFETTYKQHKQLGMKSGCPVFLKNRKPVKK